MRRPACYVRQGAAALAVALYLGELLLTPALHHAAHATESLHSWGCEIAVTAAVEQLKAPRTLPCSDPAHDHSHKSDYGRTCSTCSALNAPARVEAPPPPLGALECHWSFVASVLHQIDGLASSSAPRAPPFFL